MQSRDRRRARTFTMAKPSRLLLWKAAITGDVSVILQQYSLESLESLESDGDGDGSVTFDDEVTAPAALARLLGDPPPDNPSLWTLYSTSPYVGAWYGARTRGEQTRAGALSALSTQRAIPGGPFPDPRGPAAFSATAVLATAAQQHGVSVWPLPDSPRGHAEARSRRGPLAWIITYPYARHPDIAVRGSSLFPERSLFTAACALYYFQRLRDTLLDPFAPTGAHLLPADPAIESVLHQFAIALLALPTACPALYHCHCNAIREALSHPPADHQHETDYFARAIDPDASRSGSSGSGSGGSDQEHEHGPGSGHGHASAESQPFAHQDPPRRQQQQRQTGTPISPIGEGCSPTSGESESQR